MDSRACPVCANTVKLASPQATVINVVNIEQALRQEIAALQHELRRICDSLERGRTHDLEQRARQLRENIALCERELEQHANYGARHRESYQKR